MIQRLGGTTRTAELCEVSAQAVSQWRTKGVPKAQLKFLRLARPELFEEVVDQLDPSSQPQ
ncbi:helix-turn-helix domain-containing protein [Massilia sp. NP310]|nr:helix-turn-helix domain-containing protein [Massilia sp. NP310]